MFGVLGESRIELLSELIQKWEYIRAYCWELLEEIEKEWADI